MIPIRLSAARGQRKRGRPYPRGRTRRPEEACSGAAKLQLPDEDLSLVIAERIRVWALPGARREGDAQPVSEGQPEIRTLRLNCCGVEPRRHTHLDGVADIAEREEAGIEQAMQRCG